MTEAHAGPPSITIRREGGFRFRVRFDHARFRDLVTDEPPPLGGGTAPGPAALLGAAVGNCLASSLVFCLEKSRLEVRDLEAEVEVHTARNEQGRLRIPSIRVRLVPSLAPEDRAKMDRCLERFESFCTVTESVRAGIDVQVVVEPQAASVEPQPVAGPDHGPAGAVAEEMISKKG